MVEGKAGRAVVLVSLRNEYPLTNHFCNVQD